MALCAGAGGGELAMRIALGDAYRCVVYVEREAYAAACLVARMADQTLDPAPVWDDVRTFRGRPWRGTVDLVSAGFPCQPHSSAGKRRHTADERWIWPDIARIVREVEPGWVFLENVPPLVRGGLDLVLRDLALCGFDAEWDVFSAAQVGAPHIRERLFVLAHAQAGRRELVADPNGLRHAPDQPQSEPRGTGAANARVGRDTLADADGGRLRSGQPDLRPRRGQPNAGRRSDVVAHSNQDGRSDVGGLDVAGQREVTLGHDADRCSGATLVDADSQRQQAPRQPLAMAQESWPWSAERPGPGRSALPVFPPGRTDFGAWRQVLAVEPCLEPAVRRVADGVARGNDRLRVAGEGMVPLAAAVAFLRLRARLTGVTR